MKLEIELCNKDYFCQQSIPIILRLMNGSKDTCIPYRFNETDVLSFELSNEEGKTLATANGYTAVERRGRKPIKKLQNNLKVKTLSAYEKVEIQEELLRFIPVNKCGSYNLKALVQFEPQGISLISNTVSLNVKETNCKWFDYNDSENVFFFIQYTHDCLLGHITSRKKTSGFRKGALAIVEGLPQGSLSESDFLVQPHDTMHNYYRWIFFHREKELIACKFNGNTFSDFYSDTYTKSWFVVGRPVQHQDYSVSIMMMDDQKNIHRIKYDSELNYISNDYLVTLDCFPQIITCSSDIFGRLYLAHETEASLPVTLKVFEKNMLAANRIVIEKKDIPFLNKNDTGVPDIKVLSLNVSVKNHNAMALLALLLVGDEWTRKMYMIKVPINPADKDEMLLIEQPVGGLLIEENESVKTGHIVQDNKGSLHTVFCSTHGKLFYSKHGEYPRFVFSTDAKQKSPQLLVTLSGDIHLIYSEPSLGIKQQVLYQAPKK